MRTRHSILALGAIVSMLAVALTGCGDIDLASNYRSADVTIDGSYAEWGGQMTWVEDAKMSFGIQNDDDNLYVVLAIGDSDVQRQVAMSGLFLWFDPAGEKSRHLGIHYPRGVVNVDDLFDPEAGRPTPPDREEMKKKFAEEGMAEVEIIAPNTRQVSHVDDVEGVAVRATHDRGAMVIEYRIPLAGNVDLVGIGTSPGSSIDVAVQIPGIDREAMKQKMRESRGGKGGGVRGGGMRDGGRGGMGGRGGGGSREGMRGGMDVPDPIEVWATLQLAGPTSQ